MFFQQNMLLPFWRENEIECGCDEAGRGCLAGPVVAAAVVLPKGYENENLNDSKKLSPKKRSQLETTIKSQALAWAVAEISPEIIDKVNILTASFMAMNKAVKELSIVPERLLIDGNMFRNETNIPFECIVKGDAKYLSIAAASILAKTHRDRLMEKLHLEYPLYAWDRNKGYPTAKHCNALALYGQTPYHRRSFTVKRQSTLF